jgi:hypothetical protein
MLLLRLEESAFQLPPRIKVDLREPSVAARSKVEERLAWSWTWWEMVPVCAYITGFDHKMGI